MASKAIQRTLLVVALLATAHLLKPFSLRNVTTHLIHSATSFSFILPDSAAGSLEQANYLATALDNGWRMMEARQGSNWNWNEAVKGSAWTNETAFASNLLPPQAQASQVRTINASLPCRDAAVKKTVAKAKSKPRPAKNLIAKNLTAKNVIAKNLLALDITKSVEKAVETALATQQVVAVRLPALEIEQVMAVSLPAARAQLPSMPGVSPIHRIKAANFIMASPSKTCPMEEIKPLQPLTREEAQRKLRTSLQQLVSSAKSVRILCAQERTGARKSATQISVKPC